MSAGVIHGRMLIILEKMNGRWLMAARQMADRGLPQSHCFGALLESLAASLKQT